RTGPQPKRVTGSTVHRFQRREPFAHPAGQREDALAFVAVQRVRERDRSLLRATGGQENLSQITECAALEGKAVRAVQERERLACEPFGLGMVAAMRLDERLHLAREPLGDQVVGVADLATLTGVRLRLFEASQPAELEPDQRGMGSEESVLPRRLEPVAHELPLLARGLAVVSQRRRDRQRVLAPLGSLLPEQLPRQLRSCPRLIEALQHGEELRAA